MAIYYVNGASGSNGNAGTSAAPWATLTYANSQASPGDTIRVRTATYYEWLKLDKNNLTFEADAGHTPTIDGRYSPALFGAAGYKTANGKQITANQLPFPNQANANLGNWVLPGGSLNDNGYAAMIQLKGNGTKIKGFIIRNIMGRAINLDGDDSVAEDCIVDFCYSGAIYFPPTNKRARATRLTVTRSSNKYFDPTSQEAAGPAGVQTTIIVKGEDNIVEECIVAYCFAEGIAASKGGRGAIIRNNITHTNLHWNLGFNYATAPQFYNNISYWCDNLIGEMDKDSPSDLFVGGSERASEAQPKEAYTPNARIYNNLFVGGKRAFLIDGNDRPVQFVSSYIGYNTIVGYPVTDPKQRSVFTWKVLTGSLHRDTLVENNIVVGYDNTKDLVSYASGGTVTWRNNLFNDNVPGGMNGAGTIITAAGAATLVNPTAIISGTLNVKSTSLPNVTTTFNAHNYDLTSNSQAIGRASNRSNISGLTNPGISVDRWGEGRTDMNAAGGRYYDIGADEFGGTVTPPDPTVIAAFSMTPSATSIDTGTSVLFTDQSVVSNTTITGRTWVFKRGGTTIYNAGGTSVNYTFATAGTWTVTLTANTAAGVSDSETVTIIVADPSGDPAVTAAFGRTPSALSLTVGASVSFTNQSVVANTSKTGQTWEVVKTAPGAVTLLATATTNNFAYTFTSTGTFTVTLTVDTAAGISDSATVTYTITAAEVSVEADFTISDATVDIGDSVDFTNTSTATGTTITGYAWALTTEGAAVGFTTEDVTYTFARAGTWTVTLTVTTAAGATSTKSATVIVRVTDTYGAGLYKAMIVPHRAALSTSTGEQTITTTALGTLIPKAATLRLTAAVTDGTAANGALWAEGATDGASQWSMSRFAPDGAAGGTGKRRFKSGVLLQTLDAAGDVTGEAAFARFTAGGIVINITDAFPAAYLLEIDFYAGDDLEASCGTTVIGSVNVPVPVVTGFDQDFIYVASTWATDGGAAESDADMSRGWAIRSGAQMGFRYQDRAGVSTTALNTRHIANDVAFSGDGTPTPYTYVTAVDFTTSGFSLKPRSNGLAARPCGWLAVALGGPAVSLATEPLGTGATSTHTAAFEPQTILALLSTTTAENAAVTDATAEGAGYYAASIYNSGAEYTMWVASEDGVTTSDAVSWSDNAFRAIDHDGTNKWNGAGVLGDDGLTVTWANAPAAGYRIIRLAIEIAEALPAGPPDDPPPTADFTADVRAGLTRLLVRFDSSLSNDNGSAITAYLWDFGDGFTSTAAHPSHLYSREGSFTVTLTITNANGSSTVTKEEFIVAAYPLRQRVLVGPIRSHSITSASNNDTPLGYTGDDEIDGNVGYHTHLHDSVDVLRLLPRTTEEIVAMASESDGTHAMVVWDKDTNEIVVIKTDGSIRKVVTTT